MREEQREREREALRLATEELVALEEERSLDKKPLSSGEKICKIAKIISGCLIALGLVLGVSKFFNFKYKMNFSNKCTI